MSKRWRRLTDNEIKMAKLIFADSIDYARVKIYRGIPCLPTIQVAVSPNGNIYFPRNNCPDDFALASESHQIWMIHELTHVWQYQQGFKTWLEHWRKERLRVLVQIAEATVAVVPISIPSCPIFVISVC